jgi:lysozyme family protein
MAAMTLTAALRTEYQALFDSCRIDPDRERIIDSLIDRIVARRTRYETVATQLALPWHVIATIHALEASLDFTRHLHNGDPLTARTLQVPAGRPREGSPPFIWEVSAIDALRLRQLDRWQDWSLAGTLYQFEGYNGFGYRKLATPVASPYLWSFSNHYTKGKFVSDGTFSPTAISQQCGAAVLVRRMAERSLIDPLRDDKTLPALLDDPSLVYAPTRVTPRGAELQTFLNNIPGIYLRVDGKLGDKSSAAYHTVTGHYLPGDPRDVPPVQGIAEAPATVVKKVTRPRKARAKPGPKKRARLSK